MIRRLKRVVIGERSSKRVENVTALPGCDIQNMDRRFVCAYSLDGLAQKSLDVQLALTNAGPSGAVQVCAVDHSPDEQLATRAIFIDVVERTSWVKASTPSETDA